MCIDNYSRYVKSKFLQRVNHDKSFVIWHSLFGNPKVIDEVTMDFIDRFSSPEYFSEIVETTLDEDTKEVISLLIENYFLIPEGFSERSVLTSLNKDREVKIREGSLIDYLGLIMSEACNFRCKYCIHFNNLEDSERDIKHNNLMSFDSAKKAVDLYLGILRKNNKSIASINFGGGEPLLAWKTIEDVINYCELFYGDFSFSFSINTNASLITDEIAKFFKLHQIKVASSLDGIDEVNDLVRLSSTGGGTFNEIISGFDLLQKNDYPIDGFAVTVNEDNFYRIDNDIIDWAISKGMSDVRMDIDIIGSVNIPVDDVVEKFLRIREYAQSKGVQMPGFWLRPAENFEHSILESEVSFCGGARGASMCISPAGDVFFCGYSSKSMGDIYSENPFFIDKDDYFDFVVSRQIGNNKICIDCPIEGQCAGGCGITQEFSEANANSGIERMCSFYKKTTEALLKELANAE